MTDSYETNNLWNYLRIRGYDLRDFDCLDYEDIWENYQDFKSYPEPLDASENFKEYKCQKNSANCFGNYRCQI